MNEIIFVVKHSQEEGYEASALSHSIFTEAENWKELNENIKDAILCHFEKPIAYSITLNK